MEIFQWIFSIPGPWIPCCKCKFSLDSKCWCHGVNRFLTISRQWIQSCKSDFFIGFHMWMPWCESIFDHFKAMDSMLQNRFFHWISHVEAMMWKVEQPTKKSCRNKVSMTTLPGDHACISGFRASVHSTRILVPNMCVCYVGTRFLDFYNVMYVMYVMHVMHVM